MGLSNISLACQLFSPPAQSEKSLLDFFKLAIIALINKARLSRE